MEHSLRDALGHWAYLTALSPYYAILFGLAWRYRVVARYEKWWFYLQVHDWRLSR
jgi:hypothetical protein